MPKKNNKRHTQTKIIIPYDKSKEEFVLRKKELIIKDYESLFTVYGRQTTIVYNFRGWTVTLLSVYFTFLFTVKPADFTLIYLPGLFIILTFYILEVSERSVMKNLLKELRELERIFMLEETLEFNTAILNYNFRDLKDEKRPLNSKVYLFLKALVDMKIIFWNIFLILIYLTFTFYFRKDKSQKLTTSVNNHSLIQPQKDSQILKNEAHDTLKPKDTAIKKKNTH